MPFLQSADPTFNFVIEREEALRRVGWKTLNEALIHAASQRGINNYTPGKLSLIAIVDSGINPHVELPQDRIAARFNVVDGSENVEDSVGHGTALAGILAGSGTTGAGHGIASGAALIVIKTGVVTLDDGLKTTSVPTEQIGRALTWLIENRDRIENKTGRHLGAVCLATGGGSAIPKPSSGWYLTPTGKAIRTLREMGVLTVVGAGNSYHALDQPVDGMHWPAIIPECISVGATYDDDMDSKTTVDFCGSGTPPGLPNQIACYSNRILTGSHQTTIFAPGSILKTTSAAGRDKIANSNGTSSATPMVCATVVLAQELCFFRRDGVWPSPSFVVDLIRLTGVNLKDSQGRQYSLLQLSNIPAALDDPHPKF